MSEMDSPGKLIWHVACDESGIDGQRFYGFGSLWMKYQRRGDFARIMRELRDKHRFYEEIKWQKAGSKRYAAFYHDLVELFFKVPWLAFHCIIVEKSIVNKKFHNGDYDLARRKHFTSLITTKVSNVISAHPERESVFRVEVDPIASRYKKADEEFQVIANNILNRKHGRPEIISRVITKDSKSSENIQLSDFFLGAVMCAYQNKASSETKIQLSNLVASYLGWDHLQHDTWHTERKFNVWYFYDKTKGIRDIQTKSVRLKHPLPR
ncbi:hypothetical protein SMQE32_26660 [Serratia marcescens]|uniref:DUF3800 domain-containing protein n=2 Tax=Serratia TaxID=613 RepID=UPI000B5DF733|nr:MULTISPECIES: DUF3800 domain-containing protein [Serratia]ASL92279.1 hypothetical protein BVG94_06270 [Serratia marcescens]MBH2803942.1 DUF3800 domain-containing protein [Serratia ureilytica]MBH2822972.1 DUF3800 domain-containing protein [Serratia ureilytica]MBH2962312.1 DUF3800 domain-containing protein [Serratia ureilytica]MBN5380561.1 DUF3800 domain-containing protein [Serratia marcescens]